MDKDDAIKVSILSNAQMLFKTYGFKKTTMEDIAKGMGKGKSTLYYYYTSKEDIFKEVIQKELLEVFSKTKTAVDAATTAEEKLKTFAVTKIDVLSGMLNLYRLVSDDVMEKPICWAGLFSEYDLQETRLIASILDFGISTNEFKASIKEEMDLLPSILISSFRGVERDYFNNKYVGLEKRIGAMSSLMLDGLKK